MQSAVEDANTALADRDFGQIIDGQLELDGRANAVINPSTGERIIDMPMGTVEDVNRAVRAARRAFPAWSRRTPADRAAMLLSLADVIDAHGEVLAQLESLNVGKPHPMSSEEIPVASDVLRFMAGAVRSGRSPAADEYVEGYLSMVRREPLGVIGGITPWNFPLLTAVTKIAPALAVGNTVVLKPSELTPLTTVMFADLARAVLPDGVLNVVSGTGPEIGQALAQHPDVAMMSLTGSVASGMAVARSGVDTLKRIHLELGGKAPVVVFDDVDVDALVQTVRTAGFFNAGQECGAATRILCAATILDDVVARLCDAVSSIKVGGPDEGADIEMGPLISESHRQRVDGIVEGAISDGTSVELGGGSADRPGFFYRPTILADIPDGSTVSRVEIFGPVVTVEKFDDEEDAIRRANESDYGLSASVWTENTRRALRVSDALNYGTVWVNTHLVLANEMPWVGFGKSGIGRELSTYALDDFSRTKHVMIAK